MPLECDPAEAVPPRHLDGGAAKPVAATLAEQEAARRRLQALRLHHHEPACERPLGHRGPRRLPPAEPPKAALCADAAEVFQALDGHVAAHAPAGSDSFWRRRSYGQRRGGGLRGSIGGMIPEFGRAEHEAFANFSRRPKEEKRALMTATRELRGELRTPRTWAEVSAVAWDKHYDDQQHHEARLLVEQAREARAVPLRELCRDESERLRHLRCDEALDESLEGPSLGRLLHSDRDVDTWCHLLDLKRGADVKVSQDSPPPPVLRRGEGRPQGVEAHLDAYAADYDEFGEAMACGHPEKQAYNDPLAALHRRAKWQHHTERLAAGLSPEEEAVAQGGASLALLVQSALPWELLTLAPQLEASCFEAPKEEALRAAVRLGAAARRILADAVTPQVAEAESAAAVLRRAALALIASAASRARDAHSHDFPVEALEAMHAAGVGAPVYVNMLLAAVFTQLARAPLPPELAARAAGALAWAATALVGDDGDLELTSTSRRAVAAIRCALSAFVGLGGALR